MEEVPELSGWAQCNLRGPCKRGAGEAVKEGGGREGGWEGEGEEGEREEGGTEAGRRGGVGRERD